MALSPSPGSPSTSPAWSSGPSSRLWSPPKNEKSFVASATKSVSTLELEVAVVEELYELNRVAPRGLQLSDHLLYRLRVGHVGELSHLCECRVHGPAGYRLREVVARALYRERLPDQLVLVDSSKSSTESFPKRSGRQNMKRCSAWSLIIIP